MSQNKWDESFLRTVAALQAQISLINAEADQLTDLGDMQAQRKLKAEIDEYLLAHFKLGSIPQDPLQVVSNRLNKLSDFFNEIKLLLKDLYKITRIIPVVDLKYYSINDLKNELNSLKETKA